MRSHTSLNVVYSTSFGRSAGDRFMGYSPSASVPKFKNHLQGYDSGGKGVEGTITIDPRTARQGLHVDSFN
jgi:hypothetical protein